jgi:hypothetical protein
MANDVCAETETQASTTLRPIKYVRQALMHCSKGYVQCSGCVVYFFRTALFYTTRALKMPSAGGWSGVGGSAPRIRNDRAQQRREPYVSRTSQYNAGRPSVHASGMRGTSTPPNNPLTRQDPAPNTGSLQRQSCTYLLPAGFPSLCLSFPISLSVVLNFCPHAHADITLYLLRICPQHR